MKCLTCGRACRVENQKNSRWRVRRTYVCRHCGWVSSTGQRSRYEIGVVTPEVSIYLDGLPTGLQRQLREKCDRMPRYNAVEN